MNRGRNDLLAAARQGLDGTISRAEIAVIVICAIAVVLLGSYA